MSETKITDISVGWIIAILTIFFAVFVINLIIDRTSKVLAQRLAHNRVFWDDLLVESLRNPLKFFIWLIGAILVINIAANHFKSDIDKEIYWIKNLGITFCLSWFSFKLVNKYGDHLAKIKNSSGKNPSRTGPVNPSTISISLKVLIVFLAALMLMQTFNINVSGLLALGGMGGIILGFASKDLLSNLFGATLIYLDQPFFIGDWIKSPDREIEGIVENIGWRLTAIRTFDKRLIYVPNSIFGNLVIENPSRMITRRFNETIRLRYDDILKVETIINQIKNMLESHKGIDLEQGIMVSLSKLSEYAVEIYIDAFTNTKQWGEFSSIKQDILLKICAIIAQNKAQIAVIIPTPISAENSPN